MILIKTYVVIQIYVYFGFFPAVAMVSWSFKYYRISAKDRKSPYGITIHVIIELEAGQVFIARYRKRKPCDITRDSGRRRLDVHVVSCENRNQCLLKHLFIVHQSKGGVSLRQNWHADPFSKTNEKLDPWRPTSICRVEIQTRITQNFLRI